MTISKNSCEYCLKEPATHSFSCYQSSLLQNHIYKTNVAEALHFDKPDTIIYHIEHDSLLNDDLHWEWIIDMKNTTTKHYMAVNTVVKLSQWINSQKYNKCKNLKKITILNSISILILPLIYLGKLFLPKHIILSRTPNEDIIKENNLKYR